jgi:hypothetical protein
MLNAVYGISWVWSSVNLVMLVVLWRKFLPGLELNYLQDFSNEEISKSKICYMICAMRRFEKLTKILLKNDFTVMHVNGTSGT